MAIDISNLKINNKLFDGRSIRIKLSDVVLNWDIDTSSSSMFQTHYRVQIGTQNVNLGNDLYQPDVFDQPFVRSRARQFSFPEKYLTRGVRYFGQIKARNNAGDESDWHTFQFIVNTLPFVTNASIEPTTPSEGDDLSVSFNLAQEDATVRIRWFRNGVHHTQFDGYDTISRNFVRFNDVWFSEIIPFNSLEKGDAVFTEAVEISRPAPVASGLEILPKNPNENDVLEASFSVFEQENGNQIDVEKSNIVWLVNDAPVDVANNFRFVRLDLSENDVVRFTVTPYDGVSFGNTMTSPSVTIQRGGFRITNVRVDGDNVNLKVNSVNPTINWDVVENKESVPRFAKISIGTAPGSNNIREFIVETFDEQFTIPDNVVRKGIDYFVSVSVSDTMDNFRNAASARFRVAGSLWETTVSNSQGWTMELACRVEVQGDEQVGYQKLSFADGTRFGELRLLPSEMQLFLDKSNVLTREVDLLTMRNIIIVAKENDIKVFVDNEITFDVQGHFLNEVSDKYIEIGATADSTVVGNFKQLSYTTQGDFDPTVDFEQYANIEFEEFADFVGQSITDIAEHEGDLIVSSNPRNSEDSGKIYRIIETEQPSFASTEFVDNFDISVNSVSESPDGKITVFGHNKGASLFENFFVDTFDVFTFFTIGSDPSRDLWELVETTPFKATSYESDGLVIDTTFSNQARIDDRVLLSEQTVPVLTFRSNLSTNITDFVVEITSNELQISVSGSSPFFTTSIVGGKTLSDLVDELRQLEDASNHFFALIYTINFIEGIDDQLSSNLNTAGPVHIFPERSFSGSFNVIDPYNPNPYSKTSGGKWFYTHRKPGTPWFDKSSNEKGWTIDFDMRLDTVEDSDRPSNVAPPEGAGLYVNDGQYYENIYILPQEITLGGNNESFLIDTTNMNNYRITGKGDNLKIYAKKPDDRVFQLLGETVLSNKASNEADAGRPAVFSDDTGKAYAVWHDDGNDGNRQLYFSEYEKNFGWSSPELIVSENFDAEHPDIAVNSLGTVYVVFQSDRNDLTDIGAIERTENGWTDAYIVSSNTGKSFRPKLDIDINNNVHLVWEDHRLGQPEIFYARRNSANGQWESGTFGEGDTRLTASEAGAKRPAITSRGRKVYVAWTSLDKDGNSRISAGYHPGSGEFTTTQNAVNDASLTSWKTSGQGESDLLVSGVGSTKADHVDINADIAGNVVTAWHDIVNNVYQIFGRVVSSGFRFSADPTQITNDTRDSQFPQIALDMTEGFSYVVFERSMQNAIDPYNPYDASFQDPSFGNLEYDIYIARYNASARVWEGSNTLSENPFGSGNLGGFDVLIDEPDRRVPRRPVIGPRIVDKQMHILYESGEVSLDSLATLENQRLFINIRDAIFDLTWNPVFQLEDDPYFDNDVLVSSGGFRKELRFGDFSNNIATRMVINKIRYTTEAAIDPFNIQLISPATVNMPRSNVLSTATNNRGDTWIGTEDGILYFNRDINEIVAFEDSNFGINGLRINDIKFDVAANMYVATNNGVYVSPDHAYFHRFTGDGVPGSATTIDVDSRRNLFIGSDNGLTIIDTSRLVASLQTTKDTVSSDRTIQVSESVNVTTNEGLPSNIITKIRIDANDVTWIGTNQGLVRYKNGNIAVFTSSNGLNSNKINDIGIRDTARRYLATSAGISEMTGISIQRLDFDNLNAPITSISDDPSADVAVPKFNNAKAIRWQDPDQLFVATTHDVWQIRFIDEKFNREKPTITRFRSQDFTLVTVQTTRNDDLRTFNLIGLENVDLPENIIFEILLNGNRITRGFQFSPKFKVVRFEYPLKESDNVEVIIRNDIELLNSFEQNRAAQIAKGDQITRIEKLFSTNGNIYAQTGGDVNSLQINDQSTSLPFDRITLDTQPPQGRIEIDRQLDRNTLAVLIRQLEGDDGTLLPFDEVSGVDSLIVSNFTNFTTDGETPQEPQPFTTSLNHSIGTVFDQVTQEFQFTGTSGNRIFSWRRAGQNPTLVAGTTHPARIYIFNPVTDLWELRAELDDGDTNASVEFLIEYQNNLFVGTGNVDGSGKIYVSSNGNDFTLLSVLPVSFAYAAEILDEVLYFGGGEPDGKLFSFDGTTFSTVFERVSNSILDMVAVEGEIYAGTGNEGRIYRLDPRNQTQQILYADVDNKILSVGTATVNQTNFVYAGTSQSARIKRSKLPDGAFMHSFQTINDPVLSMENINGTLWASIGNTLFALENVWSAQFNHSEDILDITGGPDGGTWFISEGSIFRVGEETESKRIYLKLIDRAGNETDLFTDPERTQLDPNLFDEITIEDLIGFINTNRILEVDEFGNTVSTIDGDDSFFSADKVDEEVGVYMSEVFNGTNSLVSWDTISWQANIPANTSLTVQVRSGNSRDELLDAPFNVEFDGDEDNGDISFINGQYLQFKIIMKSRIRNLSPSLNSVVVRSVASESTHFFTTNFILPSRVKSGILTSTKMVPVAADVVFGISSNNLVDFAEYQIIDENRIFTTNDEQVGDNLRVGIRLITPSRGETVADDFGDYGPYNYALFFNSLDWDFTNNSGQDDLYHFRVSFFDDMDMTNLIYQAFSADSQSGWSVDGDLLSSTGIAVNDGDTVSLSFVPVGDTPIECNTFYWVKIESVDSNDNIDTVITDRTFVEACGTTFVDTIDFDFTNETSSDNNYHFRIRFFKDPERTSLFTTAFSGNDTKNWFTESLDDFPDEGILLSPNESAQVTYQPDLSAFEPKTTYYLTIDAFDGNEFQNQSNSFTFRARDIDSEIYCGPYVDVPKINNFSILFELENNQFINLTGN